MEADVFDEGELFTALARSGARVLLIGRRALIALGLPMVTADYDLWVHIDDIERLNRLSSRPRIAIDDLIATKRWGMRDKDVIDIRLLEGLKRQREG